MAGSRGRLALLLLFAVLLTGCGLGPSRPGGGRATSGTAGTPTATSPSGQSDQAPHTPGQVQVLPEGTAAPPPAVMTTELDEVRSAVDAFWQARLPEYRTADVAYYHGSSDVRPQCGTRRVEEADIVSYCPQDNLIVADLDWLGREYTEVGDSFVYFAMAHVYGHVVETNLGLPPGPGSEPLANCLAGAFIQGSIDGGTLRLDAGDDAEVARILTDPQFDEVFGPGDRTRAFAAGRQGGHKACLRTDLYS